MYYPNTPYHVYNHSNNREIVFKDDKDYRDFEARIIKHLIPVSDILCYCLIPTHFHILLLPKSTIFHQTDKQQSIPKALRVLLSSYTQRINKRYERRGSLFRAKTKYKPGYEGFIPEEWELKEERPFSQFVPYLGTCFRYIHRNPVAAGLVEHPTEWEYSSALDYASVRDNGVCSYEVVKRLLGIRRL